MSAAGLPTARASQVQSARYGPTLRPGSSRASGKSVTNLPRVSVHLPNGTGQRLPLPAVALRGDPGQACGA